MTKGGRSNKRQGNAKTGASASSTNLFPEMQTLGRGLGSAYAFALNKIVDEVASTKGSLNPFLGVSTKTLDPVTYGNNTLNPRGFDARKKK